MSISCAWLAWKSLCYCISHWLMWSQLSCLNTLNPAGRFSSHIGVHVYSLIARKARVQRVTQIHLIVCRIFHSCFKLMNSSYKHKTKSMYIWIQCQKNNYSIRNFVINHLSLFMHFILLHFPSIYGQSLLPCIWIWKKERSWTDLTKISYAYYKSFCAFIYHHMQTWFHFQKSIKNEKIL